MFSRVSFLILSGVLFCHSTSAQEITVNGRFQIRSAKVGERVPYSLSAHHPSGKAIVFPDSTFSFAPFEMEKKVYYPTRTSGGISVDSAVYFLTTFEIDSVQVFGLPVFALSPADCVAVYGPRDTLFITTTVKVIPDSVEAKDLPLKTNTNYLNVRWLLNYPILLLVGGILILLLVIGWIVFGKQIRRYFLLKRLSKNHTAFLRRFSAHTEKLNAGSAYAEAEMALVEWKKYMESLAAKPFTKFTTKEILRIASDEELGEALHDIDRMVYARSGSSPEAFDRLRNYSQDQFVRRTEEVKHG